MKKKFFCFLIMVVVQLSNFIFGVIPAEERAALIALYNSTNGDGWTNNNGWKTPPLDTDGFALPGTEGTWYGVITLVGDHVTLIDLENNALIGSIPSQLGSFSNLDYLDLGRNQLQGTIPSELANLSYLTNLILSKNQLSGTIPSGLGNLSNLQILYLAENKLIGSIPSQLGNLSQLTALSLSRNQLSGEIPPELGNLSNLYVLHMYENQLSGAIPSELGNLSNVKVIYLAQNQLSGAIPSELGCLVNLDSLILSNNQLSGSIPSHLEHLWDLRVIDLSFNQLSGVIPSELGNLSRLTGLVLSNNQLSGSIPSQMANLSRLWWLDLSDNQLSGDIPSELGTLNGLWHLYLDHNQLSGVIPSSFTALSQITNLDISYNCLSATDSALRAWLNSHDPDWETNQNQCGAVITIPTITTNSVSSITSTSAVCGGKVTSNGGAPVTSRGVCWSTSSNPTIDDSKTTKGSGMGSFTSNITGLNPGTKYYVRAYATNSKGTAYGANINFTTASSPGIPGIGLNHTALNFGASIPKTVTGPQTVLVSNTGSGSLNWSASGNAAWLLFTPSSGTNDSILSVSVDLTGLTIGSYTGAITITDPNASNSPQTIAVSLQVYDVGKTSAPFGEFATPLDGASIYNSVPVTGWVLDDIGVASVKIYNSDTYLGDALFVEGARPDVETAYPTYPNSYKAGWGYMLLTHFLPNGGNGTYTLTAKATDLEGNEVTLGSKTITIDNAHAVKPFGAIDTPTQGGTASGKSFVNFGWTLTPQPNAIPVNGSTINVVIDGVIKGHPGYNVLRSDIATLFPGYANTDGAGGYYYIDTTTLKNGLHTIAWTVSDTGGNSDGIGSRYFSVLNTEANSGSSNLNDTCLSQDELLYQQNQALETGGEIYIEIQELERVEINLSGEGVAPQVIRVDGYLVVSDQLRKLPIGSTLDKDRGVFYWQPGPGFVGEYRFIFIGKDDQRQYSRKNIVVNIKPIYSDIYKQDRSRVVY